MWPWGHAAVGYLVYTALRRARDGRPPTGTAIIWLAIGTQFPDLVDKPLAWTVSVLPAGRTLTHTLLVVVPVCAAVYAATRDYQRGELGLAFGVGYLSHVIADAAPALIRGEWVFVRFLVWPIAPAPPYESSQSFVAHFTAIELTDYVALQLALTGIAALVWWYDGCPGLGYWYERWRAVRATIR